MTLTQGTRNVLAAGIAGAFFGSFALALLVWHYGNFIGGPAAGSRTLATEVPAATARFTEGLEADDVVAVLDTRASTRPSAAPERGTAGTGAAPVPVDPSVPTLTSPAGSVIDTLRGRRLTLPVEGISPDKIVQSFDDVRSGARRHEAIDILAPRNTPVVAVEDGRIARMLLSRAGGITLYQYDPSERFVYYYAHLERYADGLTEGAVLRRGQVLGYVGTSGNAPPGTPHLHFAIFELAAAKRWWEGAPIDPFLVLR